MDKLTRQLKEILRSYEERLEDCRDKNKRNVEENWALARQVKSLEETVSRLPDLQEENERLRKKGEQSVEHARQILTLTKKLTRDMR
jgi:predicted RNase H-like nuclease (RuvC/YqgF family)